jgi:hypothetical protein
MHLVAWLSGKYQLISGYSLVFVMADIVTAMLICATGKKLQAAYSSSLQLVGLHHLSEDSGC